MLTRDAHAQDAGVNVEARRRLELHRLAVDARGHLVIGMDLEGRCGPLPPRSPRLRRRGAGQRDPELSVVDPRTSARADRAAQSIAVVRDKDRGPRTMLVAVWPRPAQLAFGPMGPKHVRHGVKQGSQLASRYPARWTASA
jgi:hypothetical protein